MQKTFNAIDPLPIDNDVPMPSVASKVRTRIETNPLRSLKEIEVGQSIFVPFNLLAHHLTEKADTEPKRLKMLEQRIASYLSRIKRTDLKQGGLAREFCKRADFAEGLGLLGIRVWRTK